MELCIHHNVALRAPALWLSYPTRFNQWPRGGSFAWRGPENRVHRY